MCASAVKIARPLLCVHDGRKYLLNNSCSAAVSATVVPQVSDADPVREEGTRVAVAAVSHARARKETAVYTGMDRGRRAAAISISRATAPVRYITILYYSSFSSSWPPRSTPLSTMTRPHRSADNIVSFAPVSRSGRARRTARNDVCARARTYTNTHTYNTRYIPYSID